MVGRARYVVMFLIAACGGEARTLDPRIDAAVPGDTASICTYPATTAFGGHHYRRTTVNAGWDSGKADCESDGGHLVKIESADEDAFLEAALNSSALWIGARLSAPSHVYRWTDGTPISYNHWAENQPSTTEPGCVVQLTVGTLRSGTWATGNCDSLALAACECDR